jgi:hypothetical protein
MSPSLHSRDLGAGVAAGGHSERVEPRLGTISAEDGLKAPVDLTQDLRRDEITLVIARLRTRMEPSSRRVACWM